MTDERPMSRKWLWFYFCFVIFNLCPDIAMGRIWHAVGDAALGGVVATLLFDAYAYTGEGEASR